MTKDVYNSFFVSIFCKEITDMVKTHFLILTNLAFVCHVCVCVYMSTQMCTCFPTPFTFEWSSHQHNIKFKELHTSFVYFSGTVLKDC